MTKTKIALFGATGKTGIEFIKMAENSVNLEILSFVRNPEKLKRELECLPKNLVIVPFNFNDEEVWIDELAKCDIWVSIIGISGLIAARKPNKLYEKTANLLISKSEMIGPSRVVVVTSGGVVESPGEPWILKKVLKPFFLNPMYEDMRVMEKLISESSMNYTVVLPPYLTNGKFRGKYRIIMDDWFKDDKVLSRKDLAHFILNQCETVDANFNKRFVGISY